MHRRHSLIGLGLVLAAAIGGCGPSKSDTPSAPPPPAPVVTQTPNHVRLDRGAHPLARPEYDVGPLDPARRLGNLAIVFKPSPEQTRERDALKAAQLDPASPSFHKWLTPEDYAARFGARPEDIARTRDWLASRGLEVHATSRLNTRVTFAGKVADVESAFRAPMRMYELGGERHYAMATAPSVPADLADVVLAVHNTHDFTARPPAHMSSPAPEYTSGRWGPGLGPADWAAIYDVAPLYTSGVNGTPLDGTGITIGVAGVQPIDTTDVDVFRSTFGLGPKKLTMTLVPNTGPAQYESPTFELLEPELDIQWAGAIAKGATIDYVFTGADDNNNSFDAAAYIIDEDLAPVISDSYLICESDLPTTDLDVLQVYASAANLEGITWLNASGDAGATCFSWYRGLYVQTPASLPEVTGVGGTSFPAGSIPIDGNGIATGYSSLEQAWNDVYPPAHDLHGSGGGGISFVFPRPAYQATVPNCVPVGTLPVPVAPGSTRQVPDISFTASLAQYPYFMVCTAYGIDDAGWSGSGDCLPVSTAPTIVPIGGTSIATPSFAGVVALLNQMQGGPLGNINPTLYALALNMPSVFHDITAGNNEWPCTSSDPGCPDAGADGAVYGYAATPGYDCASGLGSLDAYALAKAWAARTPTTTTLSASPTQTSEGGKVTLSASVAVSGSSTSILGGNVTFSFLTYKADGTPDLSWTLGEAPITGGTTTGGAASLAPMPIPVGLVNPAAQYVDVMAVYGGETSHLASISPKVRVTFSTVAFAILPSTLNIAPGAAYIFATSGAAPATFSLPFDDTGSLCYLRGRCSSISSNGYLAVGPQPGYVIVRALDTNGAEALAQVTVGSPSFPPPWATDGGADASGPMDSGVADSAAQDSGSEPGPSDASSSSSRSSGGCGCVSAGSGEAPLAGFGAAILAFGALVRRRWGHWGNVRCQLVKGMTILHQSRRRARCTTS